MSPQSISMAQQVFFGARVKCHTSNEVKTVLRYLQRFFPHWHRTPWKAQNVMPSADFCAVSLGSERSPHIVVHNAVIIALNPVNEKTISFTEFKKQTGMRGRYRKGTKL